MRARALLAALLGAASVPASAAQAAARQMMDHADHADHAVPADSAVGAAGGAAAAGMVAPHAMWALALPGGWTLAAMGQAFPILTAGLAGEGSPLRRSRVYLTQPAVMAAARSPGSRVGLRVTLNFEGLTQERGELNYGGWGEGFLDKRHPHALLHEAMASLNFASGAPPAAGASGMGSPSRDGASVSIGRGFVPYGTDDPMGRPGLKYPTNHHLAQIVERWTLNGQYLRGGWSLEAGLFSGQEPEGPYDHWNAEDFGRSWSVRLIRRWETADAGSAWEAGLSRASVSERHAGEREDVRLLNASLRYESVGRRYALAEFSVGGPEDLDAYSSVLAEIGMERGPHAPYLRVERATRPEYPREDAGGDGFFRYDHDAGAEGATAWWILNLGYGFAATSGPISVRPFVDLQWHRVSRDRGDAAAVPVALSGTSFWAVSFGARIFLGGGPMRMGSYGLLDGMGAGHAEMAP